MVPKSLEEVSLWIAEHDGRIEAWWEAQHKWNAVVEGEIASLQQTVHNLEKRVAYFAGGGAVVGAFLGAFATWMVRVFS